MHLTHIAFNHIAYNPQNGLANMHVTHIAFNPQIKMHFPYFLWVENFYILFNSNLE